MLAYKIGYPNVSALSKCITHKNLLLEVLTHILRLSSILIPHIKLSVK